MQEAVTSVLVFGGSFDPPHLAHVLSVVYALKVGGFERALVVPVFEHAFHKKLTPFEHRVRMCELAFEGIANVAVLPLEASLETPSLTLRTLQRLQADHPAWRMRLLVGTDVLGETAKWHAFDQVVTLAPLFVVARPGFEHPEAPLATLPDLSSTRIRAALAERGDPENQRFLASAVPRAVLEYIERNALY
jgi:nicotinate-nucleotide adenylyltransferase